MRRASCLLPVLGRGPLRRRDSRELRVRHDGLQSALASQAHYRAAGRFHAVTCSGTATPSARSLLGCGLPALVTKGSTPAQQASPRSSGSSTGRPGQDQAVQKGDGNAHLEPAASRSTHRPGPRRAMEVQDLIDAGVQVGQHHWSSIDNEADMADDRLVQDRVHRLPFVGHAVGLACRRGAWGLGILVSHPPIVSRLATPRPSVDPGPVRAEQCCSGIVRLSGGRSVGLFHLGSGWRGLQLTTG
jgi:hypothetical protein